ncbi:energy transducer TonB [Sphingomonas sp. KR3-1]|uniref:energy transducer TonB n=1 Tax=Sphingomonas sp. KR3-1 TaxID=3156611 RepID=UPI0032B50D3C
MIKSAIFGLALAGSIGLGGPAAFAQDKPIDTLTRSSQWLVNFDDDSCQLMAEFGPPEDRMVLKFTRYSTGDSTDIAVIGNRLKNGSTWFDVSFDFGLGKPTTRQAAGGSQGTMPAIFVVGVRYDGLDSGARDQGDPFPDLTPAQEAAITGVKVAVSGKKPFRLQFGPLDRPMATMRRCITDLVQSWGYDPVVIKGLSRRLKPIVSPGSWFSSDDFPDQAMAGGHNGLLRFRLDIDEKGGVAGCHILDRTDPDDFAKVTCNRLTKNAHFKPALDANGKVVRAFYLGSISWKA